jgi:hypothetical protein
MDWEIISSFIPGRSKTSCKNVWGDTQRLNGRNSRSNWSQEDSALLNTIIKEFGANKWHLIAKKLNYSCEIQRTGRQCRDHWKNFINPEIKRYISLLISTVLNQLCKNT